MSVPDHIFIDTCIFDHAGYNFKSARLKPFRDALKDLNLTFLDPDPTFRERNRHLSNRVDEAVRSLEKMEKSLPIITSLDEWPKASFFREYRIRSLVKSSLDSFLKPMKQVKLGYDGIDMHWVMTWYEQGRAPFGKGKKKKEFPDALAIAILDRYAHSNKCDIAVVSTDNDIERACADRTDLLYFPSLSAYLQVLQGESERVNLVQKWFKDNPDSFYDWVADAFSEISFEIEEGWNGELTDPEVDEVNISDFYVVAVGDKECTVSFEAEIIFSISADYEDENDYEYDYDGPIGHPRRQEIINSYDYSTVLAKVKLDEELSMVKEIAFLDLDIITSSVSVADS